MSKKFLGYLVNIVAVLLIALGVRYYLSSHGMDSNSAQSSHPTQALFAARFEDIDGKSQALSQWQGKIIVVNFWATWCPPCLEEMPELSQLHNRHDKNNVMVLGISTDEVPKIREFYNAHPVSYPLLSGNIQAMDLAASLGNDKSVLPYTVVIGSDGTIVKTYFGQVNQKLLEQTLLPLMQDQNKASK